MAHRRSNSSPKIRNLRWGRSVSRFNAQSAGTAALVFITAADTQDTIMRMHLEICAWIDAVQTPSKLIDVAVGAIVMPEGQGTTVVSSPITDDTAPWIFYERFVLGYEEYVTDVIDSPGLTTFRKTIDVKSMRILRPDREVQLVFEQATIVTAAACNLTVSASVLLGQH